MAQTNITELTEKIKNVFDSEKGDFAVAFQDLSSADNHVFINEKENFHAASTMKTPVMIEVFKQAYQGNFNLSDSLPVKNEFKSIVDSSLYSMDINEDSGEGLYKFIGQNKSIRDLVYNMITVSSNLATNILIQLVGADNVMKTMKSIGANDIKVLRGVEDMKAYNLGLNNTTTAFDLMIIFKHIAEGKVVSPDACRQMVDILLHQKFNEEIPAFLPAGVKVAHKTGSITGVQHDSGIVYLPDGRSYVLVLLAKNLQDKETGKKVEAEVSKLIYDFMMSSK